MKKFSFIALAALAVVACNKGNDKVPTSFPVQQETKATGKYEAGDKTAPYQSFEVTNNVPKTYLITEKNGNVLEGNCAELSGNAEEGKTIFDCAGFGTVEVKKGNALPALPSKASLEEFTITFKPKGGTAVAIVTNKVPVNEGEGAKNLGRKWVVEKTVISVAGGQLPSSLGVGHSFAGFDAPAIWKYLADNSNGLIKNTTELNGYVLSFIRFTTSGSVIFKFENGEVFYGEVDMANLDAGKFAYELEVGEGNDLINGKADGAVYFDFAAQKAVIAIDVEVDADAGYKGKIQFTVAPSAK